MRTSQASHPPRRDCACCLLKPVGRRPVSFRLVSYSANEENVVQSPTAVYAAGQHACFLSRGHGACCHSRRPGDEQGRDDRQRPGGKYKAPFFSPVSAIVRDVNLFTKEHWH